MHTPPHVASSPHYVYIAIQTGTSYSYMNTLTHIATYKHMVTP